MRTERGSLADGTTLQRFTAHLGLASTWLRLVGRPVTETTLDRVMRHYDAALLEGMITVTRAAIAADRVEPVCTACGAFVRLHRDRRSNRTLSCAEVLRRFGQAVAR